MAENGNGAAPQPAAPNGAQNGAQPQVKFQVLAQFVRDLSFENVIVRGNGVLPPGQPDIQVQVSLDAKKRETDGHYEVISKYKVESKNKETGQTLYLIELEYGGIFLIDGLPADQLHPFLLIECPRIVFPFARRIISDATRDGGFPPLNLDMIDFMGMYRQQLQRQQGQAGQPGAPLAS
ncbi:protein-export chaperone SecB [Pararhodobacter zhoushanensis]|uniref:Protein-export protein SecB n=1 Tax=Pararhodobacter zhoushanensis TaxID=2479545 RepID=A0ABT3GUH6_9RHOB|nr:protein-export chaperone SecB [Pararhodobacter zhoushanensis]MCW1931196.1 protein-export chaperone SecB [Pararhodobacter zhoushanensis]